MEASRRICFERTGIIRHYSKIDYCKLLPLAIPLLPTKVTLSEVMVDFQATVNVIIIWKGKKVIDDMIAKS
eukprot:scaffold10285_cov258-Chaetoceros_neogracile.AAC.9